MKTAALLLFSCTMVAGAQTPLISKQSLQEVIGSTNAALVVVDCETGQAHRHNPGLASQSFGPCSTFKIWNALIGLQEGLVSGPEMPFFTWDGHQRAFAEWNRDLTFKEAFKVSCVPAFQELARKIGPERMQRWLDKLGYGDRNMCGRPDAFWLPRAGKQTILISPDAQAELIRKWVTGRFELGNHSLEVLREVMLLETSGLGVLYGKTGSGLRRSDDGPSSEVDFDMGWLIGFLEQGRHRYAYACLVLGDGFSGKDAKRIVTEVFKRNGLL